MKDGGKKLSREPLRKKRKSKRSQFLLAFWMANRPKIRYPYMRWDTYPKKEEKEETKMGLGKKRKKNQMCFNLKIVDTIYTIGTTSTCIYSYSSLGLLFL